MKELYEILQTFNENKANMDFNEDFRLVQASMNHSNEFVKNFSKIQFRGGENYLIYFPLVFTESYFFRLWALHWRDCFEIAENFEI